MTRDVLLVLLSLLLVTGCANKPTQTAMGTFEYPHRVTRVDVQHLLAGDLRYNMTIRHGDVLIATDDLLFEQIDETGLRRPQTVTPEPWLPPRYEMRPGDTLLVTIDELREPGVDDQQQRRIDEHGFLRLAMVGEIRAAGP